MTSDWKRTTVGEFCPFIYGKSLPARDRKLLGRIPVVSSAGVSGRHDKALVHSGGIVIGRKGTVGSLTLMEEPFWPIDTAFYIPDSPAERDTYFTYYLLKTLGLNLMNTDSAVPGLNRDNAHKLEINVPSLEVQLRLGAFAKKLDHLVISLQRQNTALESIAQTLFQSWFVNFDPVHAKAAGNAPEAMTPELAALFPSEFEDSELGAIPKGWAAGKLSKLCNLNPESWTATKRPSFVNYIDLSGLKENIFLAKERHAFQDAPSRARRVLRKGDSLYGTVRPGNLSYGYIGENEDGLTGSTGFAVLRPVVPEAMEFVYCAMTQKENIERLTHLAEGAAYPAVRPDIVHGQDIALPASEVLAGFHKVTAPLFEARTLNHKLIGTLANLRDHLLPALISGKLSIGEAEDAVAELMPA